MSSERRLPRYPVYVPSKGRSHAGQTMRTMIRDGVPFHLVLEPAQVEAYAAKFDRATFLVLPEDDMGLLRTRQWIMEHSIEAGHERHWQFDDNICGMKRRYKARRMHCNWVPAIVALEDFTDRYTNIGISGFNYEAFAPDRINMPPFVTNVHVYSASLINNRMPIRHRMFYNDDVDICLQVLAAGWCTVLFNAFLVRKLRTMTVKGGQTDEIYHGDGRLKASRALERRWPHVVSVDRRFQRPHHKVASDWKRFDTPLIRRDDIDWDALEKTGVDDYGMRLHQVADEVRSPIIREMLGEQELRESKPAPKKRAKRKKKATTPS